MPCARMPLEISILFSGDTERSRQGLPCAGILPSPAPKSRRDLGTAAPFCPSLSLFVLYLFIAALPGWRGRFPDDVPHSIIPLPAHVPSSRLQDSCGSRWHRDISVLPCLGSQSRDAAPAPLGSFSTLVFPNKGRERRGEAAEPRPSAASAG